MIYKLGEAEYDEEDFDDMTDQELEDLKLLASKFARDQDLLITRGKQEWEAHGRLPGYGLTPAQYNAAKSAKAEALGLVDTIKLLLI